VGHKDLEGEKKKRKKKSKSFQSNLILTAEPQFKMPALLTVSS
jgi:hypothetical protein